MIQVHNGNTAFDLNDQLPDPIIYLGVFHNASLSLTAPAKQGVQIVGLTILVDSALEITHDASADSAAIEPIHTSEGSPVDFTLADSSSTSRRDSRRNAAVALPVFRFAHDGVTSGELLDTVTVTTENGISIFTSATVLPPIDLAGQGSAIIDANFKGDRTRGLEIRNPDLPQLAINYTEMSNGATWSSTVGWASAISATFTIEFQQGHSDVDIQAAQLDTVPVVTVLPAATASIGCSEQTDSDQNKIMSEQEHSHYHVHSSDIEHGHQHNNFQLGGHKHGHHGHE
jgi:hypothetical protein